MSPALTLADLASLPPGAYVALGLFVVVSGLTAWAALWLGGQEGDRIVAQGKAWAALVAERDAAAAALETERSRVDTLLCVVAHFARGVRDKSAPDLAEAERLMATLPGSCGDGATVTLGTPGPIGGPAPTWAPDDDHDGLNVGPDAEGFNAHHPVRTGTGA
ncbi:MAG TPA: hypothetical protein VF576_00085 [Rubricoccaceae bacterium]|jgi:hypothetical protein